MKLFDLILAMLLTVLINAIVTIALVNWSHACGGHFCRIEIIKDVPGSET